MSGKKLSFLNQHSESDTQTTQRKSYPMVSSSHHRKAPSGRKSIGMEKDEKKTLIETFQMCY